ncbi:MAG: hypothetical protein Q8R25_01050 [bacterium]|nr:hypothetical protein [bacterium]
MTNLLPIGDRKGVSKEFLARLAAAALIVVGLAEAILIVLVAPSYFLARSRIEAAEKEHVSLEKLSPAKDPAIATFLSTTKAKIDAAVANEQPDAMSTTLANIVTLKGAGIHILGFKSESKGAGSSVVTVNGIAADRDALLRFKERIEREATWGAVDLPVSSYAKDRDINFVIQFTETDAPQ